ncbi:MAG: DUF4249 domain-containing protein [Bacteroidales bacterium]|nr:DUF4249 domain-containing protein [Bacteroidales bacterium]
MKRVIIYLLGLCFALSSCEKIVEYNIDDDTLKPVLYAYLSDDKLTVNLFWSFSYMSDNDNPEINDASIVLYEGDSPLGTLALVSDGMYELTGISPTENTEYSLIVDVPGYDSSISAKTIMPSKAQANFSISKDSVYYEFEDTTIYSYDLNLIIDDHAGANNYYSYSADKILFVDGIELNDKVVIMEHASLLNVNRNKLMFVATEFGNGIYSILFHDRYIDGARYEYVTKNLDVISIYDPEMQVEKIVDSAFVVPRFRTVNYDYYKFYCDALGQSGASSSTSEAYYVHSNVENGFGIFAAYSEFSDTVVVHRNAILR